MAADYTRYLPVDTPTKGIVIWATLGAFVPAVLITIVGALAGTAVDMTDPQTSFAAAAPAKAFLAVSQGGREGPRTGRQAESSYVCDWGTASACVGCGGRLAFGRGRKLIMDEMFMILPARSSKRTIVPNGFSRGPSCAAR